MRRLSAAGVLRLAALAAALVLSAWMATRSRAGGDQLNLLARGWLLAARGELVPWGNPLSSGGNGPGALTSVVVGVPLALWRDHRSPVVLLWLTHVAAWLLLDRTLKSALTPFERVAYAVLWALIPWRIEASALLWNPNYLILVGAIHLATAAAARRRAGFAITFTHVLALGLGAQLHPSVLLLGVASVILRWRGLVRVSWGGFAAGVAATALSLVPWLRALGAPPPHVAAWNGFPFRALLLVQPWIKGLSYWFRYPSLAIGRHTARFDFTEALGASADRWLAPTAQVVVAAGAIATLALTIWANARLVRPARAALRGRHGGELEPREWVIAYVACAFAAACAVYAAAPTTPQSWQGLPLVHVAMLPVALGWGELFRRIGERRAMAGLVTLAAFAVAIDLAIATASPDFRCRGRETVVFPLRAWSPMFDDLGLQRSCPWPLERPGTWWPDVLPEEKPAQPRPAAASQ